MRVLVVTLVILAINDTNAFARKWSDAKETHTIEAEFVEAKDGKVYLKRGDGKTIAIPIEKLCEGDQEYVRNKQEKAKTDTGTVVSPADNAGAPASLETKRRTLESQEKQLTKLQLALKSADAKVKELENNPYARPGADTFRPGENIGRSNVEAKRAEIKSVLNQLAKARTEAEKLRKRAVQIANNVDTLRSSVAIIESGGKEGLSRCFNGAVGINEPRVLLTYSFNNPNQLLDWKLSFKSRKGTEPRHSLESGMTITGTRLKLKAELAETIKVESIEVDLQTPTEKTDFFLFADGVKLLLPPRRLAPKQRKPTHLLSGQMNHISFVTTAPSAMLNSIDVPVEKPDPADQRFMEQINKDKSSVRVYDSALLGGIEIGSLDTITVKSIRISGLLRHKVQSAQQ